MQQNRHCLFYQGDLTAPLNKIQVWNWVVWIKYQIHYTCCVCDTRSIKTISQQAYKEGVVLVQCDGCEKYHLIADNLGWFSDTRVNIEDIIAEKGGNVVKVTNSHEL